MAKSSNSKAAPAKKPAGQSSTRKSHTEPALMELFVDEIKDIYWAEKALVKALPKMRKAATSEQLAGAIEDHIEVTKNQVQRLEQVFGILGKKATGKKCEAMEGLIQEGQQVVEDTEDGSATRDVGIIIASQKIEHYEIAAYGSLAQLAKTLGLDDAAELLVETLEEEKETDELLSTIAKDDINYEALEEAA